MPTTSTRLALTAPIGADFPSQYRLSIANHATTLDNAAMYAAGTHAARLAATNLDGLLWRETDSTPVGALFLGNGATWVLLWPIPRTVIASATAFVGPATPAGNYFIAADGTLVATGVGAVSKPIMWWHIDPTDYVLAGVTGHSIVRMSLATNATAPGITFVAQLANISFAGAAGVITPTEGSTLGNPATISSPIADSAGGAESLSGAFLSAPGAYAPVINLSGATAAGSATSITVQAFALNS